MEDLDKDKKLAGLNTPPKNVDSIISFPDFGVDYAVQSSQDHDAEDEGVDTMDGFNDKEDSENSETKANAAKTKEEEKSESKSSEHEGKYFVIPRGKAMCDKGTTFPNFKVTSHQKHYWNDADGQADYLAVTEDDLTFNPPAASFGSCSVKNGNPCTFAPAGKWQKPYEKVKVMGKSCLTEASELMCTIGGKITVMKHGQQSEAGKSNVKKAEPREQHVYNPLMDFEEFQEGISEDYTADYE